MIRNDIEKWTGLSGIKLDHIIEMLEKKGIDWEQIPDWETIGQDIRDKSNVYQQVWDKLSKMYGIDKPLTKKEVQISEEKYDEAEAAQLMRTKEGVRELLRRAYRDDTLTKKKKEQYKEFLLEEMPAGLTTAIALYNGDEQPYAMCFLKEKVLNEDLIPSTPVPVQKPNDAESLATVYSYEELRQIGRDHRISVSGTKLKILQNFLKEGWL